MATPNSEPHRPSSKKVAHEIDTANPSPELKRAVAQDLDAHLEAEAMEGQATQEPLAKSQRDVEEDEGPGS